MENNSALLIMDIQGPMVDGLANKEEYLRKIQLTIDAARANNIPVIYVVVGFRPNMPEFNPRNKGLRALRSYRGCRRIGQPNARFDTHRNGRSCNETPS